MKTVKIKIGNHFCDSFITLTDEPNSTCRPDKLVLGVMKLVEEDKDIVFFCICEDSFKIEKSGKVYNNTLGLIYYKKDGEMWCCDVTPTGRIKNTYKVEPVDMTKYNMTNRTEQEQIDAVALCIPINHRLGITNY